MADFFYPQIDGPTVKNLIIMRQLVGEHPSYFLESSYPMQVEADIQTLFKQTRREVVVAPTAENVEDIDVEAELKSLYTGLKNAKPNMDDSDQMSYYRTSTALLEKLLGLQEKARNIKAMSDHHRTVLNFMEEVCSPTQVEEFMKRLKESLES